MIEEKLLFNFQECSPTELLSKFLPTAEYGIGANKVKK